METRRWTNPSQPQTLYISSVLLYIQAAFAILGSPLSALIGLLGTVALVAGGVAAGFGIANERRWGYVLGLGVASLQLIPYVLVVATDLGSLFDPLLLISALFPVALFALLVHPMSREYQRVWFH
jgi:hypothetical protein